MHVTGREVQDQVCMLSFNNCVSPFKWFLIEEQFGIPPQVDGVLGLAMGRTPQGALIPEDYSVGPLWLTHIYNNGYITDLSFSTHFEGFYGSSFIDFGPPVDANMNKDYYAEIDVDEGFFYSATPQAVRFGGDEYPSYFTPDTTPAIFSSSMSVSLVPKSISKEFFKHLLKGINRV